MQHAITNEYVSHFDPRANVCYVMPHLVEILEGKVSISYVVYDAFEGRVYANFISINGGQVMECSVKPQGHEELLCKSTYEFERLVDKQFDISR